MPNQKRSKQDMSSTAWQPGSLWQPGALGFSEPVDTNNGYFVTEATLKQAEHALQVLIRCRDRRVLDDYVPVLNIDYEIEPDDGSGSDNRNDELPAEKTADASIAQGSSVSSDGKPDLHIYITLVETKVEQATMRLHIDPPLNGNKKHKYHLPKASSAHVTVATFGGKIHAEFSLAPRPVDIDRGHDTTFDAPKGTDANVKLLLTGMQGMNVYQITGAFIRVAQEDAQRADGLFDGED